MILLHAQSGNLNPILHELESMTTNPGRDAAEICEAFVNGALIDGQADLAEALLTVWQQDFPADPQPHYARGRLFEHRLDATAAEREYRVAIERDGHHWPARYSLGRLLLSQKKASDALIQFEAASLMRDNAAPRLQVAKSLRALGQNKQARVILNDLLTYPPDKISKSFVRVGEPESRLPVELQLGLLESSLQNWSDALPWLQMVLKDDPQLLEARYSLAISLRSLGRHDDAQRELQQVARAREAIAEADRLVDEVIGRSEPCVAERCRIGELFLTYESRQRGEFWLRETLRRDPDYAPAHRLLAGYYAELAQKDPSYLEQAERHRRAAAVVPESDSPTATGFVPEGSNPSQ